MESFISNLEFSWSIMPALLEGTVITLELTFLSLLIGFVIGLPLAVGQVYGNKYVLRAISGYEKVIRSIPLLVILMLIFYGLPLVGLNLPAFLAAVIGIGAF